MSVSQVVLEDSHGQASSDHRSLAEKNQTYWHTASESVFEHQWVIDLQQQITDHLQGNLGWIGIDLAASTQGTPTKMLDYACGNGTPSRALSSYYTKLVGIDLAEGMLKKYKLSLLEHGLSEERFQTFQGDLMAREVDPSLKTAEFFNFDLVVISMALHHLEDPQESIKRLVQRLRPGGVLLVIDSTKQSEKFSDIICNTAHHNHAAQHHKSAHTIAHDGFSREQMEEAFSKGGCDSFDFVLHDGLTVVPMAKGGHMQVFFARGIKKSV